MAEDTEQIQSSENQSEESTKTNDSTSKATTQDEPKNPLSANPTANRAREDIYSRFDKQAKSPDTSSVTEESKEAKDLKESPKSEPSSESEEKSVEKPAKKQTFVKKRKEPELKEKTVPLQALHEARDRFKQLNLEYRDYRESTDNTVKELQKQVEELSKKLSTKDSSNTSNDDYSLDRETSEDPEKQKLLQEIQELKKRYSEFDREKQLKTLQEQEAQRQKLIDKVDKELMDEGYPGFKAVLFEVGNRLVELVKEGEITEAESRDPKMWKKVYVEDKFPSIKEMFTATRQNEISQQKRERKKDVNLVSSPGKKEVKVDEPENEELTPPSFDDFNKSQMKEIMENQRKRLYSRQRK